uniref:GSKIP domain-containing protein n=2 Tax=Clastoptera arizonana TaxID=38151 RepID=A0A1B6C7B5_9HEMI
MESNGETIIQWKKEAQSVLNDIKLHVQDVELSNLQPPSSGVYFNITTLENKKFCIYLGRPGFKVVGNNYDDITIVNNNQVYETPYALLNNISDQYAQSFENLITNKLLELKEKN